jgi:hypothetical protein
VVARWKGSVEKDGENISNHSSFRNRHFSVYPSCYTGKETVSHLPKYFTELAQENMKKIKVLLTEHGSGL